MRFDPHLVRPEEPPLDDAGELLLRDDLAELAAQLHDDAAHLAALYPSTPRSESCQLSGDHSPIESCQVSEHNHNRRPAWRLTFVKSVALVAAVAGLIVGASVLTQNDGGPRPIADDKLAHSPDTKGSAISDITETKSLIEAAVEATSPVILSLPGIEPQIGPASASPALFLHDYSGPELEGLYDLLEEEPPAEDSISI